MMLSGQQDHDASAAPAVQPGFQGWPPAASGQLPQERTNPKQHTVTFAAGTGSPERAAGHILQHSMSQGSPARSSHSAKQNINTAPMAYSRASPDPYHVDGEVDMSQVLGLQPTRTVGIDPARLAEQNLARGAAIARIMDAKSSFSSSKSGRSGPSTPKPGGSPPISPRGVSITQGVVGNSMRHLQPWQMPQAHALMTQQQSPNSSSRSAMLQSAPYPASSKGSPPQHSHSERQRSPQPAATGGPPAPWPMPSMAADATGTTMSPATHQHLVDSVGSAVPQHQQQDAVSGQNRSPDISRQPSSKSVLVPTVHPTAVAPAQTVPAGNEAPQSVRSIPAVQPAHQQQQAPAAPARRRPAKKSNGGLFACCFAGSALDDEDEAVETPAAASAGVNPALAAAGDFCSAAGLAPASSGPEPRSSEVWGLAKAKQDSGVELVQALPTEDSFAIGAYHADSEHQQPGQQAFDFNAQAPTGPYTGLKAEPLKLDSTSAGGLDSRVSSVGGAAYNPPGAYNPGAPGAAGSGSIGGAPPLRRMSSSRKFSRQGSRMRQSADPFLEKPIPENKVQTAPALFVFIPPAQGSPAAAPAAAGGLPQAGAFQFNSSSAGGGSWTTTSGGGAQAADASAAAAAAAAAAVAGWVANTGNATAAPPEAQPGRDWDARMSANSAAAASGSAGGSPQKQLLTAGGTGTNKRHQSSPSAVPKVVPWAGLQQQITAKQTQHQQILQKQREAEERLIQQQQQLKQQLEALRQMRSRTPSPNGRAARKASPRVSPRKDPHLAGTVAPATGSPKAAAASASASARSGRSPAARAAGSKASPGHSKASIPSSALALGDLMSSSGSSRASKTDSSRQGTPPRVRGSDSASVSPQMATTAGVSSGEQLRAAAETLLRSLDGGSSSMASEAVGRLLGTAAAANDSPGSMDNKSSDRKGGSKAKEKEPFILKIPGVNSPPVGAQGASNAFQFTSSNNSAATSTFKVPKGLLSLSFKRKKAGPQRTSPKTVRAWYRPVSLSPKSPRVKYSSFKVAASLLSPELISPGAYTPKSLTLRSPSTRFNSKKIKAGLSGDGGLATEEQGSEPHALSSGGAESAVHDALWRAPCSSAGCSISDQHSFAVSGEFFADAADEETAGTAAADYTDHGSSPQTTGQITPGALSSVSSAAGRGSTAHAAKLAQSPHAPPSKAQASRMGTGSGSPSKQQVGRTGSGAVQPRRATADVVSGRVQQQQQQQHHRASPGSPSARQQQGSYAAGGGAGRRATTGDAGSRAGQLHMMSRNSYLQSLKHGCGQGSAQPAVGAAGSSSSPAGGNGSPIAAPSAAGSSRSPAGSPAVSRKLLASGMPSPEPTHRTYMLQADGLQSGQQQQQWSPSAKQLQQASPTAAQSPSWQRQRSFQVPDDSFGSSRSGSGAEIAAREAASEITARALQSVRNRAAGMPSGDGGKSSPSSSSGTPFGGAHRLAPGDFAAYLEQQAAMLGAMGAGADYSLGGVSAMSVGSSDLETPTAAAARAAAAAAVQAVAAAADARAAEAKAAAEAALLMGGPPESLSRKVSGLSGRGTDELRFGDGLEEYYSHKQPQHGLQALRWDQALTEEQRRQVGKQEQQQQLLQKQLIEQQMAMLQQQLQQLQQQQPRPVAGQW